MFGTYVPYDEDPLQFSSMPHLRFYLPREHRIEENTSIEYGNEWLTSLAERAADENVSLRIIVKHLNSAVSSLTEIQYEVIDLRRRNALLTQRMEDLKLENADLRRQNEMLSRLLAKLRKECDQLDAAQRLAQNVPVASGQASQDTSADDW